MPVQLTSHLLESGAAEAQDLVYLSLLGCLGMEGYAALMSAMLGLLSRHDGDTDRQALSALRDTSLAQQDKPAA